MPTGPAGASPPVPDIGHASARHGRPAVQPLARPASRTNRRRGRPPHPPPSRRSVSTTCVVAICHEEDAVEWRGGLPQPAPNFGRRIGERSRQQQRMRGDPSAGGSVIRQNEQPPDIRRPPPEAIGSDARRQSTFDVKVSERLLDRGELGLQLDDEQGSTWRVPAQQVDRPALAEDRIADFGHDGPAELFEPPREKHAEPGVPLVEQPSRSPPRQRTSTTTSASIAWQISRNARIDSPPTWPRSSSEMVGWETRARSARSSWRQPRR